MTTGLVTSSPVLLCLRVSGKRRSVRNSTLTSQEGIGLEALQLKVRGVRFDAGPSSGFSKECTGY